MPNKPWPREGPVSFSELLDPVITAIESAYHFHFKPGVLNKGVEWHGLDTGAREKADGFASPSERLGADHLCFIHDERGHWPLEEILVVAIQLGVEQGRRDQMRYQKDIACKKALSGTGQQEVVPGNKVSQGIRVCGTEVDFPYGRVEHIYRIAEYTIVEYSDSVQHLAFCAYVESTIIVDADGVVIYDSLDAALAAAIAFNHEGVGSPAASYFMRMIGAVEVEGIAE